MRLLTTVLTSACVLSACWVAQRCRRGPMIGATDGITATEAGITVTTGTLNGIGGGGMRIVGIGVT